MLQQLLGVLACICMLVWGAVFFISDMKSRKLQIIALVASISGIVITMVAPGTMELNGEKLLLLIAMGIIHFVGYTIAILKIIVRLTKKAD